jgi:circadian clock protein KaiC
MNRDVKNKKGVRIPTGIKGFDELIAKGFPIGKNILINGGPGTGKTIFGLEYIYNGVTKFNEKGLYISFEQKEDALKEQAEQLGFDLEKEGIFVEHIAPNNISSIGEITGFIRLYESKFGIKRVVIDSLPALFMGADDKTMFGDMKSFAEKCAKEERGKNEENQKMENGETYK